MVIECQYAGCGRKVLMSSGAHDKDANILTLVAPSGWLLAGAEDEECTNTVILAVLCPDHRYMPVPQKTAR